MLMNSSASGAQRSTGRHHRAADGPPQLVDLAQPLGRREQRRRLGQRRIARAHQRLVAEQEALGPEHDRLVGDPEALEGPGEPLLQRRPVRHLRRLRPHQLQRLALELGQPVHLPGPVEGAGQKLGLDRLLQVTEGPVLDGPGGAVQRGHPGHHHHRQVGLLLVHRLQEVDAVHPRHGDIADHGVERALAHQLQGSHTLGRLQHRPAILLQDAGEAAARLGVRVDHQSEPRFGRCGWRRLHRPLLTTDLWPGYQSADTHAN
jgi:hypothetical protein